MMLGTGGHACASDTSVQQQTASAGLGAAPQPQQSREHCLECESLMEQLRETSDEVQQLRHRLADATKALQVRVHN